ncbi:MAG: hypothetical protein NVS4B10_00360 [Myxococcales bacterium]
MLRVWPLALLVTLFGCAVAPRPASQPTERNRQVDELHALWSRYKFLFIKEGRVVSLDENRISTSEGQSYALLRAVWSNDPWTFQSVWRWTRQNLQVRGDKLFAWKWKDRVLDINSATDADVDIALALILASRRFSSPSYLDDARAILDDIWAKDVVHVREGHFVSAGNWAPAEAYPTVHVAYLAPYAYQVFAGVDARHPWQALVKSSYDILHWLYFDKGVQVPPEVVYLDGRTGELLLKTPHGKPSGFGYDSTPLFFRMALDQRWFGRSESKLRRRMLQFFDDEWRTQRRIVERYTTEGRPLSQLEGWPQMASVEALARIENPALAETMRTDKLDALWEKALGAETTPYYLHNWLWFGRGLGLDELRHYDEFLGFLRPFDAASFWAHFPWAILAGTLVLAPFASRNRGIKIGFLAGAFALSIRYLAWRFSSTLNFYETLGPAISFGLLGAELYSFSTVALLVLQVGTRNKVPGPPPAMPDPLPTVDIFIPIYSESLEILDKTLTAAAAIRYANKRIHVCDDSHRETVANLAREHGAGYIRGPKKHAKAGNLNNALQHTNGELLVVFDTDHVPVESFLEETVRYFSDPRIGIVQTPHHFYNQDIFQRALGASSAVPNEQDMFNHAIQGGRDTWGGAFFVGSGAVFRRSGIEALGGFKLMSITEDIHTSQHLHAAGWKSAFVDKDLAVGLTAENLSGYIVQRRRWMQGCLQIFFKDNPLLCRGLPLRHRVGYFASLYYFFFPLTRVVFWVTPLFFLFFQLHPLFADVSVLLGYLLPYLLVLPIVTRICLPGWPRFLWGTLYETVVSFTLVRGMIDLVLPKSLGFKVTPKGITSDKRRFDFASSRLTAIAAIITLCAVAKGAFEFWYFGIEKDAYFINLLWASSNLIELLVALLIAWERPQRRAEERLARTLDVELRADGFALGAKTLDLSLSGLSLALPNATAVPQRVEVTFSSGLSLAARLAYSERIGGRLRCALEFVEPSNEARRALVRMLFSRAGTWDEAHAKKTRSAAVMGFHFLVGIAKSFLPLRRTRRTALREPALQRLRCVFPGGARTLWLRDRTGRGLGFIAFGERIPIEGWLPILGPGRPLRWSRVVHQRTIFPGIHRIGLELVAEQKEPRTSHAYLAA